ncbi:hypothetical protein ZOSMA_1G03660 [Zostera marina]|uniref:Uncharacterized protein n=1 Tax=Zostera marina TaxID=29655 RepID=A0A0K9PMT3_ZOSMR|nr:hypothetical protein ZOSMA_1G03660 [Zostera marina]
MSYLVEAAMRLAWLCSESVCRNTDLTVVGDPEVMGDFNEIIQILADFKTDKDWLTFTDVFNREAESRGVENLCRYDELIDLANQEICRKDDAGKKFTREENSSELEKGIRNQLMKILINQRKLQEKKIAAIVVSSKFINLSDVMDVKISKKFMRSELTVMGINNTLKMKVRSDKLSLRHRRTLFDEDDNPIVHINKKLATIHGRWQVFKGGTDDLENLLYEVMKCNMIQFTNEYKVFLAGNTEEEKFDFLIKHVNRAGTYFVKIGDSDEIIAQIRWESKIDAYGVTIYPFVDYAFVISLIAILYVIDN